MPLTSYFSPTSSIAPISEKRKLHNFTTTKKFAKEEDQDDASQLLTSFSVILANNCDF